MNDGITLAVLTTDGRRDCIVETIGSAIDNLTGPISRRLIFADTDGAYMRWLEETFDGFDIVPTGVKQGYAQAMRFAFRYLRNIDAGYTFWLEDDFTFNRPIDLDAMRRVLDTWPAVAQMALRRQPWNAEEEAAGGVVELHSDAFTDCHAIGGDEWLEQTAWWTNNPSLIAPWVFTVPYPTEREAEGKFTFALKGQRPDVAFGYWGARASGEAVHHIGEVGVRGR